MKAEENTQHLDKNDQRKNAESTLTLYTINMCTFMYTILASKYIIIVVLYPGQLHGARTRL